MGNKKKETAAVSGAAAVGVLLGIASEAAGVPLGIETSTALAGVFGSIIRALLQRWA